MSCLALCEVIEILKELFNSDIDKKSKGEVKWMIEVWRKDVGRNHEYRSCDFDFGLYFERKMKAGRIFSRVVGLEARTCAF